MRSLAHLVKSVSALMISALITLQGTAPGRHGGDDHPRPPVQTVAVRGVIMEGASSPGMHHGLSLKVGDTRRLVAMVLPHNATNQNVTWSSSDPAAATVDANGVVTAVAEGTATITVTTEDGGHTAFRHVRVSPIHVRGVIIEGFRPCGRHSGLSLIVGETKALAARVFPHNATNKTVTWSSSDATKASVDANGLVTARAEGIALITVTTEDGGHRAACHVKVSAIHVTGVTLNITSASLVTGETLSLAPTITPANATYPGVAWSSNSPAVATVNGNGVVAAMAPGVATITATTVDGGLTATCAVMVSAPFIPVASVTLNLTSTALTIGGEQTFVVTITPADATNQGVTWTSDNPAVATVDGNGKVTTVGVGTANITVTTMDRSLTATCALTVNPLQRGGLSTFVENGGGQSGELPAMNGFPALAGIRYNFKGGDHHILAIMAALDYNLATNWNNTPDHYYIEYADEGNDKSFWYDLNWQELPTGTKFGMGATNILSEDLVPIYLGDATPGTIPVLTGFAVSYDDNGRDHHLGTIAVELMRQGDPGYDPSKVQAWMLLDDDPLITTHRVQNLKMSYAEVPVAHIRELPEISGDSDGNEVTGSLDAQLPVLQGFCMWYWDGDHHIDRLGAEVGPGGWRVTFEDENHDDSYRYYLRVAEIIP